MHLVSIGCFLTLVSVVLAGCVGPRRVSFPTQDGGVVHADVYGDYERAVVLAHGGRFNKESWASQAHELAKQGFRVVAIDFRGRGLSRGGTGVGSGGDGVHFDVLAAVDYLRRTGAKTVSVVGASFGGWAAAGAAVAAPGEIDRIVLLATTVDSPELRDGSQAIHPHTRGLQRRGRAAAPGDSRAI